MIKSHTTDGKVPHDKFLNEKILFLICLTPVFSLKIIVDFQNFLGTFHCSLYKNPFKQKRSGFCRTFSHYVSRLFNNLSL